jgi:integrase
VTKAEPAKKARKGNGNGSIQLLANGNYRWMMDATPSPSGKRKRISGCCGSKREAEKALREALVQKEKGVLVIPAKTTLEGFLNDWLDKRVGKVAAKTNEGQRQIANTHIIPALGGKKLQAISKAVLQGYYDSLNRPIWGRKKDIPLGSSMQTSIHAVIHSVLGEAARLDHIPSNPAEYIRPNPTNKAEKKVSEEDVWTPAEVGYFLEFTRAHPKGYVFEFLLLSGTRKCEAAGLRWANINLEAGTIHIAEGLVRIGKELVVTPPKTKSSNRILHISADMRNLLERIKAQQEEDKKMYSSWTDSGYVFTMPNSNPRDPATLQTLLDRWVGKIGSDKVKRIVIHGIRHTVISLLLKSGVKPEVVARLVGHAKPSITLDTYRSVYKEELVQCGLDLNSFIPKQPYSSLN